MLFPARDTDPNLNINNFNVIYDQFVFAVSHSSVILNLYIEYLPERALCYSGFPPKKYGRLYKELAALELKRRGKCC